MKVIEGNLLDAFDRGDVTDIMHVVNCQGIMGGGIALQISERYPKVYKEYANMCYPYVTRGQTAELLGSVLYTENVFNLFGQNYISTQSKMLDDSAFIACLRKVEEIIAYRKIDNIRIGIPYKIGCGLAGGDWGFVKESIYGVLIDAGIDVVFYKYML